MYIYICDVIRFSTFLLCDDGKRRRDKKKRKKEATRRVSEIRNFCYPSPNRSYSVDLLLDLEISRFFSVLPRVRRLATTAGFFLMSRRRQSSARFSTASVVHRVCISINITIRAMLSFSFAVPSLAQCGVFFFVCVANRPSRITTSKSGWIPNTHNKCSLLFLHFFFFFLGDLFPPSRLETTFDSTITRSRFSAPFSRNEISSSYPPPPTPLESLIFRLKNCGCFACISS